MCTQNISYEEQLKKEKETSNIEDQQNQTLSFESIDQPAMIEQVKNREGTDKTILAIKRGTVMERTDVLKSR